MKLSAVAHFRDMPNDPETVCLSGKSGSERRAVKVTRLTQPGPYVRFSSKIYALFRLMVYGFQPVLFAARRYLFLTSPPSQSSALHAAAWTLGAIVPWATMAAAIDAALKMVPSSQLLFWSFVFATPAAFLWDRLLGGRPAITLFRIELPVLLIGLLGIFGWTAGVQLSLDRAPVIEANLLTYLWPLLMVAMSPLAGERFSAVSLFGVVVGFVGAALITTGGKGVVIEPGFYVGYSLALFGAVAWAMFVILLQRQGSHATGRTPVFVAAGCVCAFAMAFGIDGKISIPPPMAILAAAWLGIGPMSLAFVCWDRAVTSNHLALVGRLSYFDPLISTLLLMIFMGLLPTLEAWIGMILIILGVALPEIWTVRSHRAASK